MPPVRSGVAACSADAVAALGRDYDIDVFVGDQLTTVSADFSPPASGSPLRSAHDFVWRHRQHPYALTVYQLGNSAHHDFLWPYLFRFPGLAVLHDARLHHARAAALLRAARGDDYRAEFAANHPSLNRDLAELAPRGFDSHLYYAWPMTRLIVRASRVVAVHSAAVADELREENPSACIEVLRLGHGRPNAASDARAGVRARYGIPDDAVVFGCFGGLSPEKRLPQVLAAFAWLRARLPDVRLLLAGAAPDHYPLALEVSRYQCESSTTFTGYLDDERDLTDCIAATDVALTLRWPTAREVSGPWLRCLALGKPTVTTQLQHMVDVPALDPRDWRRTGGAQTSTSAGDSDEPITVAVDILDEDHSLRLAMRRLATDRLLRESLGRSARVYWEAHHSAEGMVDDYRRIIQVAIERDKEPVALPAHLINDGDRRLRMLLEPFGLASPWSRL